MITASRPLSRLVLLAAGLLSSHPALAEEPIPPPADAWMLQGTAYPVLVDDLTGLWADAPPVQAGFTKICNVRFMMQPGHLTQTSYGKCLGGLEASMESFLQGMFVWPLDGANPVEPNGFGVNVVLRSYTWGLVPRLEAEPETPFLEVVDGQRVPFLVWSPAVAKAGPQPEPSKKQLKAIGTATCTLSADVAADGSVSNLAVVECPEAAQKPSLKAAQDWTFQPLMVDGQPRPSAGTIVFEFVAE